MNHAHSPAASDFFNSLLEEYPDLPLMLHNRVVDQLQTLMGRIEDLAPRFDNLTPADVYSPALATSQSSRLE